MDGSKDARRKKSTADSEADIALELRQLVRRQLAPYAAPDVTLVCPSLPKTRSGKIMRRILRKIAKGDLDNLGDISTLADPSVVDTIVQKHKIVTGKLV